MGVPALTRQSRLIVGGEDWVADLTDDTNGFTLNDSVTAAGTPATGIYWVEKDLTAYDRSLNVPTVYYGAATQTLSQRTEGVLIAAGVDEWDGGLAGWLGLPSTAPIGAQLTNNVNFIQRAPWASGTTVAAFEFTAGDTSVDLGPVLNTQVMYLAVTRKTVTGARVVTLGDGTDDVGVSLVNPGVVAVPLTGQPNSVNYSVSVAALTGDQTIAGVVVAGDVHALPDGRTI